MITSAFALVVLLLETVHLHQVSSFQAPLLYNTFGRQRQETASQFSQTQRSVSLQIPSDDPFLNGTTYLQAISDGVLSTDDSDLDQQEVDRRRERIMNRIGGNYKVTLNIKDSDIGMTLSQVDAGLRVSSMELNLDSLTLDSEHTRNQQGTWQRASKEEITDKMEQDFTGVVVAAVVEGGSAWKAGIRPGDVLLAVSATVGKSVWPKSSLEGVRSAIVSRKIASGTVDLELRRAGERVDNQFELSLTKPIGLLLQETQDGYVEVSGFTENAPNLVKYAVKVGDRVLAVDSSLGDRMWPVSTVEGVISACTSRLPGQSINIRFERPAANLASTSAEPVAETETAEAVATVTADQVMSANPSAENRELLSRCRSVLGRYVNEDDLLFVQSRFRGKFAIPALVADKVVDALASASTTVDTLTLSMIMRAYLSCRQPEKVIKIFEAVTGFSGDASSQSPSSLIEGKDGKTIVQSESALNIYTVTPLLQAHAMRGDLDSVVRVVAAVEGRSGIMVGGTESAPWPWTGTYGPMQPDTRFYNAAIAAAEKVGGPDTIEFVFDVFNRMPNPVAGSQPELIPAKDVVTYNTLISALANVGAQTEAFELFETMKRSGIRPDKYTYTSLIKACYSDDDVQELLYDMEECGVDADVVTYNTMIKSLCTARKWTQATRLTTEMEARDISPDSMTYSYIMTAMLKADKANACLALFESACNNPRTTALTENVYLYTTAITAASMLGDHERALEFVSRMNAVGLKPNVKTITAVMGACLSANRADLAAQLFQRISNPDSYAMVQGIQALSRNGEADQAAEIVRKQKRGSSMMSGKDLMTAYGWIIRTSLEDANFMLARDVLDDLFGKGYIPSKAIFASIAESINKTEIDTMEPAFLFAMHLIDVMVGRKLPISGRLYADILFLGSRLGGIQRKISSLLMRSKVSAVGKPEQLISARNEIATTAPSFAGWEGLLLNFDLHEKNLSEGLLPDTAVRIRAKDVPRILKAEQGVTFSRGRSKSKRRPNKTQDRIAI